ncbi:hypothetical protein PENTCL1PPCAC_25603 [Pristionchus entomophagus]|uniref:tRNA-intron lyase n=1 Tax=Pristionchus entomophagus TaxID=358040 RepID=A0AAV5UBD6_9BILA|nr:hypothetical protein PENTCL1PPCAC_25603 [Pristionchus entomophagus]
MSGDCATIPGASNFVPPRVHFVNGSFVILEKSDADSLVDRNRILPDFGSSMEQLGPSSSNSCYSYLLPEQVAVSLDHGFITLVRLKRPVVTGNDDFTVSDGAKKSELECLELAQKIAVGRKMKDLKRKMVDDGISVSKKLRLDEVLSMLTPEELDVALTEVRVPSETRKSVLIRLHSSSELAYESLPFPQEFENLEFQNRKIVFRDLWSRGFYVTSGVRFGCHFLVYKEPPGSAHAEFMVRCVDSEVDQSFTSMLSFARTANQVCKKALLAIVSGSLHPQYLALQSFTPLLSQDGVDQVHS